MKRRVAILCGLIIFAAGASLRAETDDEVEAHRQVLDLTGAFSNDGFKLRDGHWAGQIKPAERVDRGKSLRRKSVLVFRRRREREGQKNLGRSLR